MRQFFKRLLTSSPFNETPPDGYPPAFYEEWARITNKYQMWRRIALISAIGFFLLGIVIFSLRILSYGGV